MIQKSVLLQLYVEKQYSLAQIATLLGVSVHTVTWWARKHQIAMRSRSDALYIRCNPNGDPFCIKTDLTPEELALKYLGIGLFWGEGNKVSLHSVRLGNTDPRLIKAFVKFLKVICGVREDKIHYGLQIFSDINPETALHYWQSELNCGRSSFLAKITVSPPQGKGTYRKKCKYGVLNIYVHNKKLRDWMMTQVIDCKYLPK